MSAPASVEGHEHVRLFCALTLPQATIERVVEWQERLPPGDYRLVPPENLHITIAFLGRRPTHELGPIQVELEQAVLAGEPAEPVVLRLERYRETRSVGMLVFEDEEGRAASLAAELHARLERLGVYEPEQRRWLPHLTVVRFRTRPRLAPPLPDLGEIVPSEAAVYYSVLRPVGAEYVVLHTVPLMGG
jgi:2'-5' RNA ligase